MSAFNEEEIKDRSSETETTTWGYVLAFVAVSVRLCAHAKMESNGATRELN